MITNLKFFIEIHKLNTTNSLQIIKHHINSFKYIKTRRKQKR